MSIYHNFGPLPCQPNPVPAQIFLDIQRYIRYSEEIRQITMRTVCSRAMSDSPNSVTIDLSALQHNFRQVKRLVGEHTRIMGVVKSDAYGHGMVPVSRSLEGCGVDCLGVAHVGEALDLRMAGIGCPIVILYGVQTREEAGEVVDKDLVPVIFDLETARVLDQEAKRRGARIRVRIKVDTGMGRLGIPHGEVEGFLGEMKLYGSLDIEGLISHLSSADEMDGAFTRTQIRHFREAVRSGRSMGWILPRNSLSNSAGTMIHPDSHHDMVRPGIMLYGGLPSPGFQSPVSLKPVMCFRGKVLQVRDLPDGTPVSYGRTYTTRGPQRVAVLSAGYGSGLPRSMSNRGMVLIGGKRVKIIGRVSMNLTMVCFEGQEKVGPGDEAVFLGTQGQETIWGDEVALWAGTISYEIFCAVGQSNSRRYVK